MPALSTIGGASKRGFGYSGRDGIQRIPVMSGYTHGIVTVSTSSELGSSPDWRAYKATDTTNLAGPDVWHSANAGGQWWKIDFGQPFVIYQYLMAQRTDDNTFQMSGWQVHGSMDDSNWTLLHQVTGKTWGLGGMSEAVIYDMTIVMRLRYLRVTGTSMENGSAYATIGAIQAWS